MQTATTDTGRKRLDRVGEVLLPGSRDPDTRRLDRPGERREALDSSRDVRVSREVAGEVRPVSLTGTPVCYLDVDGVLADFHAAALSLHGRPASERWKHWSYHRDWGLSDEQLYAPMNRDFWASLPWCLDGRKILDAVLSLYPVSRVVLLTAPAPRDGCEEGKRDWVRRNLPGDNWENRLVFSRCKPLLAGPNKVLIDDNDESVLAFEREGGRGVLVPRPWNNRGSSCSEDGTFDLESFRARLWAAKWRAE